MEALNQKERTAAFWKFILTFLVLVIFVVLATFMVVDAVPGAQLDNLQRENESLKKQVPQIDNLVSMVNDIQKGVDGLRADSIGNDPVNAKIRMKNVTDNVAKLMMMQSDSSSFDKIENTIAGGYAEWISDIQTMKASSGGGAKLGDLQRQLSDCNKANQDLLVQVNGYKALVKDQNR